mmetsp:Transcript_166587/g.529375  ORF Transcript_166587/g.529375 Transcript_166587/m.529375 type:complete len:211 (+) Transcript_166587:116-748(+)
MGNSAEVTGPPSLGGRERAFNMSRWRKPVVGPHVGCCAAESSAHADSKSPSRQPRKGSAPPTLPPPRWAATAVVATAPARPTSLAPPASVVLCSTLPAPMQPQLASVSTVLLAWPPSSPTLAPPAGVVPLRYDVQSALRPSSIFFWQAFFSVDMSLSSALAENMASFLPAASFSCAKHAIVSAAAVAATGAKTKAGSIAAEEGGWRARVD